MMLIRLILAAACGGARALRWIRARLTDLWVLVARSLAPVRDWQVRRLASPSAVVGLVVLVCASWPVFQWRNALLGADRAIPDSRLWYSAEYLAGFFGSAGPSGRTIYAATQLSLDLVFPLVYASLLTVLVHLTWRGRGLGFLWPLPLLAGIADIFENLLLSGQAAGFGGQVAAWLATVTAVFTLAKFLLLQASFLLLGGIFGLGSSWWVGVLGLLWVVLTGALVTAYPAALVPALLLGVVIHRRWVYLFQYLFFLRYPLLGAAGLVLLPVVGRSEAGQALLANLFILPEWPQMLFVSFLAGMLAMTVLWTVRLVLRTAPARLHLCLARDEIPGLLRALHVCGPTDDDRSLEAANRRQLELAEWNSTFIGRVAPALIPLAPWVFALAAFPLAWAVWADSHRSWPTLIAMIAMLAGWATLARLLLTRVRPLYDRMAEAARSQPWAQTPLGRAATQPAEAPIAGFGGQGHLPLLLFALVVAGTYVLLGAFLDPVSPVFPDGFPAVGFLLLIAVVAVWALSTIALILDRPRVPVIAAALAFLVLASLASDSDHYYRLVPRPEGVDHLPTPVEAIERWREGHPSAEYVTVVAASGGGIKASLWTATVMRALLAPPPDRARARGRQELGSSIVLLSTNSGGSVGGMFVTQAYADGVPPARAVLDQVVRLAGDSSLTASMWGMAYPDLWRFLSGGLLMLGPRTIDRGWAMDRRWEERRASLEAMLAPSSGAASRTHGSLGHWALDVREGKRPAHIFNATVVESGAAFRFATVDLGHHSPVDAAGSRPHEFWEFYDCARADVEVATAARLSATFPWISPMARAWADPDLVADGGPCFVNATRAFRLADGGYFDNFGVFSAIEFLEGVGTAPFREGGPRRILFVQIRATPEASASMAEGGVHYSLFGPIMAMNSVRSSSQIARNDLEVDLLRGRWADEAVRVVPVVFDLSSPGPLSWHLSRAEQERIEAGWTAVQEERLAGALDVLLSDVPPPGDPESPAGP